jgi:hypothetical protein
VKNAEVKAKRFMKLAEKIEDIRIGMKIQETKEVRRSETNVKILTEKQMKKFV